MEILNIEGISFPVAKYNVIRITPYATENSVFYAPADMKFRKVIDFENSVHFEDKVYSQQEWVGVTEYSKEKEKISHNMHYDICGKKDDYPVINTWGLEVNNIGNKYLIWHLKDCAPKFDEVLPETEHLLDFPEPLYFVKKSMDADARDSLYLTIKEMNKKSENKITTDDIELIESRLWRPYHYVKVNGLSERGDRLDITSVVVNSWCIHCDCDIKRIERETCDFTYLTKGYDRHSKLYISTKEEFDEQFNKILNQM